MEITVRQATAGDKEAIAAFARDTFAWGDYVLDIFDDWLRDASGQTLVAADPADRPIAVARVEMLSAEEAWMQGARVHPDHRRQGIGLMLNDAGATWARERGAVVTRLVVEEGNEAPRRQVTKAGYRAVSNWVHADRSLAGVSLGPEGNGGRRVRGEERLRPAHSSEAEPAFLAWSTGDLIRAAHGLYPLGWRWRRMTFDDVADAARRRALYECPSGWVIADVEEDTLAVSWLVTGPDDAAALLRAVIDRAHEHGTAEVAVKAPNMDWLVAALEEQGLTPEPLIVYEKEI